MGKKKGQLVLKMLSSNLNSDPEMHSPQEICRYRQKGGKVWSVGRLHLFTECDET